MDRLITISRTIDDDTLDSYIRNEVLDCNAYIRKNKNKQVSKGIVNILRKLGISKEDEVDYDEEYRSKQEVIKMEGSLARKKNIIQNLSVMASSRVAGPENLRK